MKSRKTAFLVAFSFTALMASLLFMQACSSNPTAAAATPTPVPATNTPIPGTPTNSPTKTPTSTPTNTATNTPTSTPSNTPTATCSITTTPSLIDDLEAGTAASNQVIIQQCRSGFWFSYNDGSVNGRQSTGGVGNPLPPAATATATTTPPAALPWAKGAPGVGSACTTGSSTYAVEVSTNNGFTGYGDGFGFNLTNPQADYDASAYTGIKFCGMNSLGNLTVNFAVPDHNSIATSGASGPHAVPINLTSTWQQFTVTFAALAAANTNTYGTATVFQSSAIQQMQWQLGTTVVSDIWIDNLTFY